MATLKVAVVEEAFAARDYRSAGQVEYFLTPVNSIQDLKDALYSIKPDVLLLGEDSSPFAVAPHLKDICPLLLVSDSSDSAAPSLHIWRRALATGISAIIAKPVTFEKITAALAGSGLMDEAEVLPETYLEGDPGKHPGPKLPKGWLKKTVEAGSAAQVSGNIPEAEAETSAGSLQTTPAMPFIKRGKEKPGLSLVAEKGRLITFFNTKGGVGKTLWSINTAAHFAKVYPSKRIALVDFDLDFGDVANFLGLEPKITALSWQHIPDDNLRAAGAESYLLKHKAGFFVLPAPLPPIDEDLFTHRVASRILAALKQSFDLTIVDLGPTLRDITVITLEHADIVYLLTTADIASIRNAHDMVRIFDGLKISPEKIRLFLNALKKTVDDKEIRKYIPYRIALKAPYIGQVSDLHGDYRLATENRRFRHYLDQIIKSWNIKPITM
jgi:cellulose biosynthesis protein BcsQ